MPKLLALDPAASCGWALGEEREWPYDPLVLDWGTWNLDPHKGRKAGKNEHPGAKLIRLRTHLLDLHASRGFDRIVYEDTSAIQRNRAARLQHGKLTGIIYLVGAELGVPVRPVGTTTMKLALTGAGNAQKPDCVRAVAQKTNIDVGQEFDAADAIGLLFVEREDRTHAT